MYCTKSDTKQHTILNKFCSVSIFFLRLNHLTSYEKISFNVTLYINKAFTFSFRDDSVIEAHYGVLYLCIVMQCHSLNVSEKDNEKGLAGWKINKCPVSSDIFRRLERQPPPCDSITPDWMSAEQLESLKDSPGLQREAEINASLR